MSEKLSCSRKCHISKGQESNFVCKVLYARKINTGQKSKEKKGKAVPETYSSDKHIS